MNDRKSIESLERDFWQALVDKDSKAAAAMIADRAIVIGPSDAMAIDPAEYTAMMKDGNWELTSFEFSETEVVFPTPDTAVIAYKVRQKGTFKGGPMDMTCADSTLWVKDGGNWTCALHTETVLEGT